MQDKFLGWQGLCKGAEQIFDLRNRPKDDHCRSVSRGFQGQGGSKQDATVDGEGVCLPGIHGQETENNADLEVLVGSGLGVGFR